MKKAFLILSITFLLNRNQVFRFCQSQDAWYSLNSSNTTDYFLGMDFAILKVTLTCSSNKTGWPSVIFVLVNRDRFEKILLEQYYRHVQPWIFQRQVLLFKTITKVARTFKVNFTYSVILGALFWNWRSI